MLDFSNIKRAWIVGDIHIGLRSANMEWFEITKTYFEQYLIPLIKNNYKEDDVLIQLGDLFDNRQIINIKINSYTIDIIKQLSDILPIFIICGNHDIYYKKTNEITSLDSIKYIPNVYIFKEPNLIKFNKYQCLMMPWRDSPENEFETLKLYPNVDFVFCHSEFQGVQLNLRTIQNEGIHINKFENYKRVYSGHIHYAQIINNIVIVGNAYQMTRSDINNPKGVYLLDFNTGEHQFFENTITPKFIKLNILDILELTLEELKNKIKDNFVDFYIPSEMLIKYNVNYLLNLIQDVAKKIEPIIYDNNIDNNLNLIEESNQLEYKNFDILNLCYKWIDNLNYNDDIKNKMKEKIKELYLNPFLTNN